MTQPGRRWLFGHTPQRGWLLPAFVLAVSLFMRLFQIDLAPFDSEQVLMLRPALRLAETGQLPPVGGLLFRPGIHPPPLVNLFLAPPLLFSHNPLGVAVYQCLIDALTALVLYWMLARLGSSFAGAAAGLLYAVLPAALLNARYIGNIGPVPFLCALALFGIVAFLATCRSRYLALSLIATGLATELHLTVGLLFLLVGLAAAARWSKVRWAAVAGAVGVVALPLAPYVMYQAGAGWLDARAFVTFLRAPKVTNLAGLDMAVSMLAGDVHGRLAPVPLDPLGWLVLAVLVAGAVIAVRGHGMVGVVVVLFVLLPIAGSIRQSETIAPYYLLPALPAGAALAGIALAAIPWRVAGVAVLALMVLVRGGQWIAFQGDLAAGRLPPDVPLPAHYLTSNLFPVRYSPPYNVPLRFTVQAAALAERLNPSGPAYVGPREEHDWVFDFLAGGRFPFAGLTGDHTTLLPTPGSTLILDGTGQTMAWPLQQFATPAGAVAPVPDQAVYSAFRLEDGWLAGFNQQIGLGTAQATFAGRLDLTGFSLDPLSAGHRANLTLEWQPHDDMPLQHLNGLHFFARLVDAAGKAWSSDPDVDLFAGTEWRPGAAILSETEITPTADAPTGGYWLELGLYRGSGQRLPVSTGGTELRPGPFKVRGASPVSPTSPPKAIFGAGELALDDVQASGKDVQLTWTALAKPLASYTVFVHALDASGRVVAQHDGIPGDGSYPTSLWDAGETVQDTHHLAGSFTGAVRLEIGLYTEPDQQRLPVALPDGAPAGTAFDASIPSPAGGRGPG